MARKPKPPANGNGNGNSRDYKTVLTYLNPILVVIGFLGTFYVNSVRSQDKQDYQGEKIAAFRTEINGMHQRDQTLADAVVIQSNRVTIVERDIKYITDTLAEIKALLTSHK